MRLILNGLTSAKGREELCQEIDGNPARRCAASRAGRASPATDHRPAAMPERLRADSGGEGPRGSRLAARRARGGAVDTKAT